MPKDYDPNIAHITVPGDKPKDPPRAVFQVLNDAGDDWDEATTQAQYEAWFAAK